MKLNIIHNTNCLEGLKLLADNSVDCCVTSPPYYGLRDYGHAEQIGMERTPEEFVSNLVQIFEGVRRVLKKKGTLWLNIGDSYGAASKKRTNEQACRKSTLKGGLDSQIACKNQINKITGSLKAKDLIGIPWMVAFALRSAGWYLRQDIIWQKPSCMPESVTDRCTKNHEYIFLLSKSKKYYFDSQAIQEDAVWDVDGTGTLKRKQRQNDESKVQIDERQAGIRKVYENVKTGTAIKSVDGKRNKRSVWSIVPAQFPEAHFATFPEEIPAICIKAGCPKEGIVLDPFMGAGTTALVANKLDRNYIGFELNQDYINITNRRLHSELGMFIREPHSPD